VFLTRRAIHPSTRYKTLLLLDIDAFPLNREIVSTLIEEVDQGVLVGAVTRSGMSTTMSGRFACA
jgi:hypothetical protein